ncbi:hypothetical protein M0802_003450 [Mischocyttarus mexicanus]|nr:hypothetical protein M0802_003450 [Mischocyttarus mexicanus]
MQTYVHTELQDIQRFILSFALKKIVYLWYRQIKLLKTLNAFAPNLTRDNFKFQSSVKADKNREREILSRVFQTDKNENTQVANAYNRKVPVKVGMVINAVKPSGMS